MGSWTCDDMFTLEIAEATGWMCLVIVSVLGGLRLRNNNLGQAQRWS